MEQLTPEEVREIEEAVDRAFLKLTGRTWREDEVVLPPDDLDAPDPPPATPRDSLEAIKKDYPRLFP